MVWGVLLAGKPVAEHRGGKGNPREENGTRTAEKQEVKNHAMVMDIYRGIKSNGRQVGIESAGLKYVPKWPKWVLKGCSNHDSTYCEPYSITLP